MGDTFRTTSTVKANLTRICEQEGEQRRGNGGERAGSRQSRAERGGSDVIVEETSNDEQDHE